MERYTLNEIAKKLGISKNAVKYRVKKLNQEYVVNEDGKWFVSEKGLEELKELFGTESREPAEEEPVKEPASSAAIYEQYIETLKAEISQKNKQLEDLQRLFDQEQKLHAQDLLMLQKPQEEPVTDSEKRSFWNIFKKK